MHSEDPRDTNITEIRVLKVATKVSTWHRLNQTVNEGQIRARRQTTERYIDLFGFTFDSAEDEIVGFKRSSIR